MPRKVAAEHLQPGMLIEFSGFTMRVLDRAVTREQVQRCWDRGAVRDFDTGHDLWFYGRASIGKTAPWKITDRNAPGGFFTLLEEEDA